MNPSTERSLCLLALSLSAVALEHVSTVCLDDKEKCMRKIQECLDSIEIPKSAAQLSRYCRPPSPNSDTGGDPT